MKQRIHIIGASGSGTSTLGTELANRIKSHHLDTDDYFWLPPKYHCNQRRERKERQNLLMNDLTKYEKGFYQVHYAAREIFIYRCFK